MKIMKKPDHIWIVEGTLPNGLYQMDRGLYKNKSQALDRIAWLYKGGVKAKLAAAKFVRAK